MSKLLFNRPPMVMDPDLAVLVGGWESMFLQQIHYWVEINRESGRNYREGEYWTYNTYENWQKQFPWLSVRTIKRVIINLESKGLLITGNFNTLKIDRTKWYRIDYGALESMYVVSGNGGAKLARPSCQNGPMGGNSGSEGYYDTEEMHRAGEAARDRERYLSGKYEIDEDLLPWWTNRPSKWKAN